MGSNDLIDSRFSMVPIDKNRWTGGTLEVRAQSYLHGEDSVAVPAS